MRRGVLLGLSAYAAFSFSDAFIKLLKGGVPTFQLMFMGAAMGLLALPLVKQPQERWSYLVTPRAPGIWWLRMLAGAVNNLGALLAFTHLPMAEAFALIFLMPIFVTLLSVVVLREHVGWRRWLAVIAGFAGVLVVLRPGFRELHIGHLGGIICGLAGACGVVLMRRVGDREHRLTLLGTTLLGNLLVAGVLMWPDLHAPTALQWAYVAGFGLLSALGTVLLMQATLATPVNHVAPTQYSQMLWSVLLGWWLFHDRIDALTWVGIGIILAAGLFTLVREERVTGWWHRMKMLLP
ncbi:EamA family transporter [Lysobacter oculi]|uniref:EamA family transporter n=1 Tax=Solilutibacter oculi TaxID=2698682 RepID=A0A344J8X8_9GAMM|nr:DMT family transporter [Lysobacter oculi]AXA85488.1 EamA family transporter [Lysobacter oculi]